MYTLLSNFLYCVTSFLMPEMFAIKDSEVCRSVCLVLGLTIFTFVFRTGF